MNNFLDINGSANVIYWSVWCGIYTRIFNTYGIQIQDNMGLFVVVQPWKQIRGHKLFAELFGTGVAGIAQ